jgi:signal transduction histidine kinase
VSLHQLLPLAAFLLNVSLLGIALLRNSRSRLNRLFAYFVAGFALWNLGVFLLRRAPDEPSAFLAEIIVHVGIIALPAFYYHFVLIFLDSTVERRTSLLAAYGIAAAFMAINLSGSALFMKGVKTTTWGWAPVPGILYNVFILSFYTFFVMGLVHLGRAYRRTESSFRRNRAMLILIGTSLTIGAGFIDIIRFALAKSVPVLDKVYPPGIPANMICALLLGMAIIRYRMFDVSVAVKKYSMYALAGGLITGVLALGTRIAERAFDLEAKTALWVVIPLGLIVTVLMGPLGQAIEDRVQRLMFSRRRGSHDTLLALSTRMGRILDMDALIHALVHGVLRGVPLTHCALLLEAEEGRNFAVALEEAAIEQAPKASPVRGNSRLVEWLRQTDDVLVKDELKLNPRLVDFFEGAEDELEELHASLVVALKTENKMIGILLLGEKLSGEIFDDRELQVLRLLASQAAISLENARLYEELGESNAQLLQASRLKSQFLAGVSHELRTPLNSIIGFSKVLLNRIDGDLNERQEKYVRSVHTSSQHLLGLINSILDISSIEAGRLALDQAEFELAALIDECVEVSLPLARGKPIKLDKSVAFDLPTVSGDRAKIRQVLLNLLSNAIKFTPSGRVSVAVKLGGDGIHVAVSDTGVGIRREDLGRLFEPFERLENPVSRDVGGTGLGLAISKKFVELHGGKMWAESRENAGSTFHFTLPCAPVPAH